MILIKVSDELMGKLGAKTASEFLSNIETLLNAKDEPPKATDNGPLLKAITDIKADIVSLGDMLLALEIPKIDTEEIARIASVAASKITSQALAAVGTNPAPIGVPNASPSGVQTIADDDYEGQWKASEQLRGEFGGNQKAYIAYKRAEQAGRVKLLINTRK